MYRWIVVGLVVSTIATPAIAQSLGDVLKVINRAGNGATTVKSLSGAPVMSVPATQADSLAMKSAIDRAVTSNAANGRAIMEARPVIEKLLMTIGCATTAKALHGLNRYRLEPRTYSTLNDDHWFTAMGVASVDMRYHDRRTCAQVSRISDLTQPAPNALSLRVFYLSPSSGEARSTTVSFRRLDGEWLIDALGYF